MTNKEKTQPNLTLAFKMPPEKAVKYLEQKGYKITENWYDMWEDAHARAFTVAKMAQVDLLKDTKKILEEGLENGASARKTQKELENLFIEKGWWGKDEGGRQLGSKHRIKTIYKQNIQSAYNAGRYLEQLEDADIAPYWQYICVLDNATRPEHRALHGKVFRYDDPFWQFFYPPNGWGCRCIVRVLTGTQFKRMGLNLENSENKISTENVSINNIGETKPVSVYKFENAGKIINFSPDAGWSSNTGAAAWNIDVQAYTKIKELPQDLKDKFISDIAQNLHNKNAIENTIKETLAREGYRSRGVEKTLTWFTPTIIKALEKNKIRLQTPVAVFEDRQVRHSLAPNVKVNTQMLTKPQFMNIYNYIQNPDEIYIDTYDAAVVYVKNLPKNEIIDKRDCIKIPVKINSKNKRRPVNYIGTTGRVNKHDTFSDVKRYKKIE